ncbi:MAG TPA: hypothetical protein VGG51_09545 [Candidatus Cybelea sp.]|jgi:hypothetical protein
MNTLKSLAFLAALAVAGGFASGCGAPAVPASAPLAAGARSIPPSKAAILLEVRRKSHVDPSAKRKRLLYVADSGTGSVYIYTYPQLTGAGALSGFPSINGVCTDRRGYIWILDTSDVAVWEFAHGGSEPINILSPGDASGNPGVGSGCSVDPKTGDLAVAGAGPGVTVFRNGQENHATYWDYNFFEMAYAGYDGAGNLFVDGSLESSFAFGLAELATGSSSLSDVTLSGGAITSPGGIAWDGKYLDIGNAGSGTIYQTDGASILGSIATNAACQAQFYILRDHKRVIVPDLCNASTGVYAYPAGGAAIKTVSGGQELPRGVAISVAGG